MYSLSGTQILAFVGVKNPTQEDVDWSDMVAKALVAGLTVRLNGAIPLDGTMAEDELNVALLLGGAEGYKRKEATFAQTGYADPEGGAITLARDYLDSIKPLINRHSAGPGIG
jgi:hypothetical protein